MDKEEAKLILSGYRPNGRDAQDPEMSRALELAGRDPEVAGWFKREQEMDRIVGEKLAECPVPESLKTSIIAGRRLVGSERLWKFPGLLATAAVLMVLLGGGVLLYSVAFGPARPGIVQGDLDVFRSAMVAVIESGVDLDVSSGKKEDLEAWLADHGSPIIESSAATGLGSNMVGCKSLRWNGKSVSLFCYRVAEGEILHVFVMNLNQDGKNGELPGMPNGHTRLLETVNRLNTATWQEQGKVYLMVGNTPSMSIIPYL